MVLSVPAFVEVFRREHERYAFAGAKARRHASSSYQLPFSRQGHLKSGWKELLAMERVAGMLA